MVLRRAITELKNRNRPDNAQINYWLHKQKVIYLLDVGIGRAITELE